MRYAKLITHSQREMEQHNRTTGWEMRLLLLFSLYELSLQLFTYMAGPRENMCLSCYQHKPTLSLSSLHASKGEL